VETLVNHFSLYSVIFSVAIIILLITSIFLVLWMDRMKIRKSISTSVTKMDRLSAYPEEIEQDWEGYGQHRMMCEDTLRLSEGEIFFNGIEEDPTLVMIRPSRIS
jgi:hypothetical protein